MEVVGSESQTERSTVACIMPFSEYPRHAQSRIRTDPGVVLLVTAWGLGQYLVGLRVIIVEVKVAQPLPLTRAVQGGLE